MRTQVKQFAYHFTESLELHIECDIKNIWRLQNRTNHFVIWRKQSFS